MDRKMKRDLEKGIKILNKRGESISKRKSKLVKSPLFFEDPDHLRGDMGLQFRDTASEPHPETQGKNIEGYTGRGDEDLNRREKSLVNYEKNEPNS